MKRDKVRPQPHPGTKRAMDRAIRETARKTQQQIRDDMPPPPIDKPMPHSVFPANTPASGIEQPVQRAVDVYKATPAEWENAKANGIPKMAQVNYCRREGFVHNGWFVFSVPGFLLKCNRVDRWLERGQM